MSYGLLLLRVVFGLALAAHGAQKLFGGFGGHGVRGTAGFFGQLGFRAPLAMAVLAGGAELGGGLLLALGLATPLAAFAIVVVMLNAIWAVHWKQGFWNANGGYEMTCSCSQRCSLSLRRVLAASRSITGSAGRGRSPVSGGRSPSSRWLSSRGA
jgi:putative oxidoreductase